MSSAVLYLDTSAWIKLYLEESEKLTVLRLIDESDRVATHLIAYAELFAGLAKAHRMKRMTLDQKQIAMSAAEQDWNSFLLVTSTQALTKRAAHLADRFALRGYDSIHLSAAEVLMIQIMPQKLVFASEDAALNTAASSLGLIVPKSTISPQN